MRSRLLAVPQAAVAQAAVALAVALAATTLAACTTTTTGHGQRAATCAPVFFGVAGSGQGSLNPPPTVFPATVVAADAYRYGTTVALLKTKLVAIAGSELASTASVAYPAIPVSRYLGSGGLTADLDTSEAQGATALVRAIRASYARGCPDRPVLLSGYSQGAEVVIEAVDQLTPREQARVSVALFGNPSYQPGVTGDFPGHSLAFGIRPTFRQGEANALPADVRRRTIDICAPGDPVCGVEPTLSSVLGRVAWVIHQVKIHEDAYAFGNQDYAATAAQFLWDHVVA